MAGELRRAGVPNADRMIENSRKELDRISASQSGSSVTLRWKSEGESILLSAGMLAGLMMPSVEKVRVRP
jgi:hypothetical protein